MAADLETRLARAMRPMRLSSTMLSALDMILRHGGEVEYRRGGFWTYPDATENAEGTPEWYTTTQTVRALRDRGLIVLRAAPPRTFDSAGTVTEAGRRAGTRAPSSPHCPHGRRPDQRCLSCEATNGG